MTKRLNANRRNALLSTGPRTSAGLKRSSQNATRHGLSKLNYRIIQAAGDSREDEGYAGFADRYRRAQEAAYAGLRNLSVAMELGSDPTGALRRLAALERYRRPLFRAWLRALKAEFSQNEPIESESAAAGGGSHG